MQEDGLIGRLRWGLSASGSCRSYHLCLLFCIMYRCLQCKLVNEQDKCVELGNRESRGSSADHSFERLVSLMGRPYSISPAAAGFLEGARVHASLFGAARRQISCRVGQAFLRICALDRRTK
jgi:hypothetical protein